MTERLVEIERTLRHARATQPTEHDSWLNAYRDDVLWLTQKLRSHDNEEVLARLARLERWAEDAASWSDGIVAALDRATI